MQVSIIIVNYNTKQLLEDCIQSIYDKTDGVLFEIIVVDNASTDGSQEAIKTKFPAVILIESEINLGFGKANNLGATYAKGALLFLLNSDTILFENSVKILNEFFLSEEKRLNIGVLGAILVDQAYKINGFGSHFPICSEENKNNLRGIPIVKWFVATPQKQDYDFGNECFEIDYVIGADMFLRRKLFEEMNGFCEDFFMYYEESDLQKRIHNTGLKQYILTKTKIIHLEDGSGKAIQRYSNRKRIIVHKSRITYLKKNDFQGFQFFKIVDLFFLISNLFNYKYSFKENINYFKTIIKTYSQVNSTNNK